MKSYCIILNEIKHANACLIALGLTKLSINNFIDIMYFLQILGNLFKEVL